VIANLAEPKSYAHVASEVAGLEVGILVNNVGASYDYAEYLTDISDDKIDQLIQLNVIATTKMTRAILPGMIERKRGAIVNISSAAGSLPIGDPLYAVYSGTKAYVDAFSKSLHYELKKKGIFVQSQVPYFVSTKLSKIRSSSLGTPSPDRFAASAINAIGLGPFVVPYWVHALEHWVIHSLAVRIIGGLILGHHFGIRARALKKIAAAAKQEGKKAD